ncbi:hypothetical protein [Mycobacteroides abscessus]|uniref:hypothetical protein n=1 Tax=Mycobacteroides abscessus TaxID=36809 RepID=UPI00092BDF67|nr:hypothetical protein [Mycobacteroides abscessus]SKS05303.1 Uncharacterised protein [Mycobacteroides abscessus subsp. abscessus]SHU54550.1 Uncharacterised protein [Mycobacteroides abscessus subsp. bolletii]SHW63171.1 Uncharacterised protein [Mycobacteroides abscessus subsp. bolletii]SHW91216.1 Uncharacterised protein [Mycobacteroides abscessus subsp. bolletii]SHX34002.1 Uncharacterised protein [Mycobacteroides abscessus subsp. bolletii]
MSAIVRARFDNGLVTVARDVNVPQAVSASIDDQGRLVLYRSSWQGEAIAIFNKWDYYIITPERGPDGKFIKRS